VPGLALRISHSGHKSFVLHGRFPLSPTTFTRRSLGEVGALTLERARIKARDWLDLMRRGIDPKTEEERTRTLEVKKQANSFEHVAREYIERHVSNLANYKETARLIEREFIFRWASRPVGDIQPMEVSRAIRVIAKRAPYQAYAAYACIRGLYNWAIGTNEFGLSPTSSPVLGSKPKAIIGKAREPRARILTDEELLSVWNASSAVRYPFGSLVQFLILTGQRVREAADMSWPEVNFSKNLWTIPAHRMKSRRLHEVPLAPDALSLLQSLKHFNAGDFVFTTTSGLRPISGFSKAKQRIDEISAVSGWRFHDLRRTMRSRISSLPVEDLVRELVIAHAKPGLHQVYDLHTYEAEKRRCLELWEQKLQGIVSAKLPADVITMQNARRRKESEK
jgi:integrase